MYACLCRLYIATSCAAHSDQVLDKGVTGCHIKMHFFSVVKMIGPVIIIELKRFQKKILPFPFSTILFPIVASLSDQQQNFPFVMF